MPGYDFLVQAVGGLMSITGDEGGHPLKVGVALVDVLTALFACNAILAAVVERAASGRGQHVEVDLLSCSLAALINQASTFVTTGHVPRAMGNRHPSIAPYQSLHAADREMVVTVGNDGQFAAMAQVIGEGWMAGDERFAGNAARIANRREMTVILESALASRPAAEWVTLLMAAGVPSGVVNGIDEAFALAEHVGLKPVIGSSAGVPDPAAQVADPMRLDRTPVSYRTAPPRLGEHTEEVERELGIA
jgi:crotonobetainyl-CoA:carnitine CoA-transferase CaiB-like acyl-CoA transferase